jgi:response regulator of citrate/malate metabolism
MGMPETVADLVGYSGLSAQQMQIVRFLEKDPSHGYTVREVASAIHAGRTLLARYRVAHELEDLVSQGRIRSIELEGHRNYFLR